MNRPPRAVVVTRPSDYEALLARHGTREQARFFLDTRGLSIDEVESRHRRSEAALAALARAVPTAWRRVRIARGDLASFLFEPDDIVVAVGQDGLVANVAKYLAGQLVIGLNPDPEWNQGVLVPHRPERAPDLLRAAGDGRAAVEERTMVEAVLDDGQRLLALNEIFIGHTTHQSARYTVRHCSRSERQSSSGLIVATGTGATGWARSIARALASPVALPAPADPRLAFFVREPFPSVSTGTSVAQGLIGDGDCLEVVSEMNEGGTLFGDGIEIDRLALGWGVTARVRVAREQLRLVV